MTFLAIPQRWARSGEPDSATSTCAACLCRSSGHTRINTPVEEATMQGARHPPVAYGSLMHACGATVACLNPGQMVEEESEGRMH